MAPYTEQQRAYWHSAFACGPPTETRFTITSGIAGQGYWYNRRSGSMVGSATGSLVLAAVGTINRFGISTGDLLINRAVQLGGFNTWVLANPGYSFTLTFLDAADRVIVLTSAEQDGTPGGGFIRFDLTPAQLQIANTVSVGHRILVVIKP